MNSMPHRRSVVLCPKANLPAAVDLDDSLGIKGCSRLPVLKQCEEDCGAQLHFCAEELEDFLTQAPAWCSICGTMLNGDDWYASRMAAANVSDSGNALATSENGERICWNCYSDNAQTRARFNQQQNPLQS